MEQLIGRIAHTKESILNVMARMSLIFSSFVRLCHDKPNFKKRLQNAMTSIISKTTKGFQKIFKNLYLFVWLENQVKQLHYYYQKSTKKVIQT